MKGEPSSPIEVGVDWQCRRGEHSRAIERDLEPQVAPISRRLGLPMRNPDWCYLSVDVWFVDTEVDGRISAKLFGPPAKTI